MLKDTWVAGLGSSRHPQEYQGSGGLISNDIKTSLDIAWPHPTGPQSLLRCHTGESCWKSTSWSAVRSYSWRNTLPPALSCKVTQEAPWKAANGKVPYAIGSEGCWPLLEPEKGKATRKRSPFLLEHVHKALYWQFQRRKEKVIYSRTGNER